MTGALISRQGSTMRPYQLAWWLILVIRGYRRFVSPLLGQNCRYNPTCSTYALVAITRYGSVRGGWMASKRLGRCHPFREGGNDPVPEPATTDTDQERSI